VRASAVYLLIFLDNNVVGFKVEIVVKAGFKRKRQAKILACFEHQYVLEQRN
jgi:hypothetical protein